MHVDPYTLTAAVKDRLVDAGLRTQDAEVVARVLVDADSRGHRSHGTGLLPLYLQRIDAGGINPAARPRWVRDGVVSILEAHGGPGQVAAMAAAEHCAQQARRHGLAAVAVRGNNHIGMLAAYRWPFSRHDVVALISNVSGVSVAPPMGQRAALGNNALCAVVPRSGEEPFVVDFATGAVACGKVREAAAEGRGIPDGWVIDASGRPTRDPHDLDRGGAVTTFGGHKGLCVALVVELLGGILGGRTVSPRVRRQRLSPELAMDCSQLFIGLDPKTFDVEDPAQLIAEMANAVADASERVWPHFPDQQESEAQAIARREGIRVRADVAELLGDRCVQRPGSA